jgi:putative hydrolase of the HAD superfamily
MTPRAVLFDLDDTLLDYSSRVAACWAEAVAAKAPPGVSVAALVAAVEDRRAWFWSDPVRHQIERTRMLDAWTKIAVAALAMVGHPAPADGRRMAEDFAVRRRGIMRLFDDALPCLEALRRAGCKLGMVTNGDAAMQRDKISRFALAPWFDAILIEGEFGVGKPDPAVYRHMLAQLDVPAAETVMVGDNLEWDVYGAQRVGLGGIWIDRPGRGVPAETSIAPSRTVRTLRELHW